MIIVEWRWWPQDISSKKIKDSHFKARNRDDDIFATGAPSKRKAKYNGKNNSERWVCIRWITKGHISFGEACAFMIRTRKAKRRATSFIFSDKFTTPKRGSDDGSAKRKTNPSGKSPSGKKNRQFCTNFKKWSCQKRISCNYLHFPECTKFKAPTDCRLGDKWKNRDRWPFTVRRMMNDRCNCGNISRMTGPTNTFPTNEIGTYTWSHADLISKSAESKSSNFEKRSIDWTLNIK